MEILPLNENRNISFLHNMLFLWKKILISVFENILVNAVLRVYPQSNYDELFAKKVYSAPLMPGADVKAGKRLDEKVVRVEYTDKNSFKKLAKMLGLMDDFKVCRFVQNVNVKHM